MFYIYFCPKCGFELEKRHGINEKPIIKCPNDNTLMIKKITGGIGTIYKGFGWASKGTATAPTVKHTKEVGVAVPKFFKDIIKRG